MDPQPQPEPNGHGDPPTPARSRWHRMRHWSPSSPTLIKIGVLYLLISSTAIGWSVFSHSSDLAAIRATQIQNTNGQKTTASDKNAIAAGITAAMAQINANHLNGVNGQEVICATLNGMVAALKLTGVPTCIVRSNIKSP